MTFALDGGQSAVPVHRQLKDTVYAQLRDDIVNGTLPPGATLREAELTARFGVSKTPLRDALARLEKDGFVEIPPYRSAVVVGYSRTDLQEIYELRELLEGSCARRAASAIGREALAELAWIVRRSAECLAAGQVIAARKDELADLLDQFDQVMHAQAGNSRIAEMLDNIRGHIKRIGRLTTEIPGRLVKSVHEHEAIYEAIVQRDSVAAEALMRRHILSVMADQLMSMAETTQVS